MSRSRRKTPISGICGGSEKYDKRLANRRLRRKSKAIDNEAKYINGYNSRNYPLMREVSNVWSMNKDGKVWRGWHDGDGWLRRK